jgi:hypothetical protein
VGNFVLGRDSGSQTIRPDFCRLSSYQFDDEKDMRIKRALMAATEISPIIENFNIGNICTVIADMCVAHTGNIAVPVIADIGVNIADLHIADIDPKKTNGVLYSRTQFLFSCLSKYIRC